MLRAFLYRRLSKWITCEFRLSHNKRIMLSSKHHVAAFQDVFINPFYWECLNLLPSIPKKVVDLGANYGYFSILCHRMSEYRAESVEVYLLVEANKYILKALENNLLNFGVSNTQFEIFHGLAGPIDRKKFVTNTKNHLASAVNDNEGPEVDCIDFNQKSFQSPDLIKIDIEGSEYELIENYLPWLCQAKHLIVELHGNEKQNKELLEVLNKVGFSILINHNDLLSGYDNVLLTKYE